MKCVAQSLGQSTLALLPELPLNLRISMKILEKLMALVACPCLALSFCKVSPGPHYRGWSLIRESLKEPVAQDAKLPMSIASFSVMTEKTPPSC